VEGDEETKKSIKLFISKFMSSYIGRNYSFDEVVDFARAKPENFLQIVEKHKLFVAPGGSVDQSVADGLEHWKVDDEKWRTADWSSSKQSLPPSLRVFSGIIDRLSPQYHMMNNAHDLAAHPLVCIEQQAHYFRLVSNADNTKLEVEGLVDKKSATLINSLSSKKMSWLSNAPNAALIAARKAGGNANFRARLQKKIDALHSSKQGDFKRVLPEIVHEVDQAISEHNALVKEVDEKYINKHAVNAITFVAGVAANLLPSVGPLLGTTLSFAAAVKAASDVSDQDGEKERLATSMIGVVAAAKAGTEA
jgi:hypothetical protein